MTTLTSSQFNIAFDFARSEVALARNSDGTIINANIDAPRFDHSAEGDRRGLLVTSGFDLGGQDRVHLDALMLPAELTESYEADEREATVYHLFRPSFEGDLDQASFEAGIVRLAYYTREALTLIDALMSSEGHHLSIGVHAGFAANRNGYARYRGKLWQLPLVLESGTRALAARPDKPLIASGARLLD